MSDISAIASELLRIQNNIDNALNAVKEKGVTVANDATSDDLAAYIMLIKALTYTNLVPTSTDTDGSIFNGTGYKENVRLSSSGGISGTPVNGSVTTGFMPYGNLGVVRIKGARWKDVPTSEGHYYIYAYDASKSPLSYVAASDSLADTVTTYDEATGVTTFDFTKLSETNSVRKHFANASFIRINAKGLGAELIVTVNEEI